jgi:hypothetical protein
MNGVAEWCASSTNVAPQIVSMRVVKISIASPVPASGNVTRAPSDRTIQFRYITTTFSGHWLSVSRLFSSSSAYSVIRKNYCSRSRRSTTDPQRQHVPSITCSLARTVLQLGHQLTVERLRYARPRSNIFRKIHWLNL